MHILVFLPENAIITPKNVLFPGLSGLFSVPISKNAVVKKEKTLASPQESNLSWRWSPVGQKFKNHAGKLPKDDPSVVAKKKDVPCNGKR